MTLKHEAVFISDVHYALYREESILFFEKMLKTPPPQLFLMGDIFDFLVGEVDYSIKQNRRAIEFINRISQKTELFYFEGNHDYNLKKLFKDTVIFSRRVQPVNFEFLGKKILISHGDIYANNSHELYFKLISNRLLLHILNIVDTKLLQNRISKKIYAWLAQKRVCRDIENFAEIAEKRVSKYDGCDIVIEGHHHQNVEFVFDDKRYINLGAFACNRSYFCVESLGDGFVLSRASL